MKYIQATFDWSEVCDEGYIFVIESDDNHNWTPKKIGFSFPSHYAEHLKKEAIENSFIANWTAIPYERELMNIAIQNEPMKIAIREEIRRRTPKEWGIVMNIPKGWEKLVEQLFIDVVNIYPDLEIHQIKEKFGGLRFYSNVPLSHKAWKLISEAERKSYFVCQTCGADNAETRTLKTSLVATLCDVCYNNEN